MNTEDYDTFADAWAAAWEAVGRPIRASAIEIAFEALRAYPLADVTRALTAHIRNPETGVYPPKPADVVRYLEGDPAVRAAEAWAKIDHALRCRGPYETVVFDDPLIHLCVEAEGGWIKLCGTDAEELPFLQNRLVQHYRRLCLHRPREYPAKLVGLHERDAVAAGESPPAPLLLGDEHAARSVLQQGREAVPVRPIERSAAHLPPRRGGL